MTSLPGVVGVARSFLTYYAIPFRLARLQRFFRPLLKAGDLAFDLGAHAGNHVHAWIRLGAHVIALEPHPGFFRWLQRLYGRHPRVTLLPLAVGASPGMADLLVSRLNPTVSTLSPDWRDEVRKAPSFAGVRWETSVPVEVTNLDALIDRFGVPAFCKIDVEGLEADVLSGLSMPLPCLSFEYLPPALDRARQCLERLEGLADYAFNWSIGERHRWAHPEWVDGASVRGFFQSLRPGGRSGDIYARRRGPVPGAGRPP